ncbi:hypothetical protein HanPI659440_Chr12g0457771 [Helianthus annuus]|nr:hypothetical protein HanPI659440_Chr12g0457771 [Helianthus annuus]
MITRLSTVLLILTFILVSLLTYTKHSIPGVLPSKLIVSTIQHTLKTKVFFYTHNIPQIVLKSTHHYN